MYYTLQSAITIDNRGQAWGARGPRVTRAEDGGRESGGTELKNGKRMTEESGRENEECGNGDGRDMEKERRGQRGGCNEVCETVKCE